MEQQNQKCTDLSLLVHSLSNHNINLILSFLDSDSIDSMISASNQIGVDHCRLISVARIKNFVLKYLNKTDRSIYIPFYSEPHFIKIENQQLAHLTTHQAQGLRVLSTSCQSLLQRLSRELNGFQMGQAALDSLVQSLTDPQLPFPKMRKQDIGMHCNSAFQFYLVDQLFSSGQEEEMEETFEELRKYLSQKWTLTPSIQKLELNIIEEVFSSWYKIGYENYQQYLLPSCTQHNLVVIVIALLDLFVDSFSFYLQSIEDPLYSFIEFNMRFCIFRNMILSLQGKLGFLFRSYSAFCVDVLQKKHEMEIQQQGAQRSQVREMTIWHCGLSKWYIYMQHLHHDYFKTYFYLLKKANLSNIKDKNLQQIQDDETFIQLQNRLEINEVHLLEREKTFQVYSPIEDIFDQSPELYSQILKEYIEYIVDISINEYSVHWCGHSSHLMHVPYQEFDRLVVQHYQSYINKLDKIACSVSNPTVAIDSMLTSMIQQLDKEYLKPVTLKKIIDFSKEKVVDRPRLNEEEELEFSKMTSSIESEITNRDKVLDHFNNNAGISNEVNYKYSIVLESEDFAKMLKTSASTNASTLTQGHIKMHSIRSSDSIMEQDFL